MCVFISSLCELFCVADFIASIDFSFFLFFWPNLLLFDFLEGHIRSYDKRIPSLLNTQESLLFVSY